MVVAIVESKPYICLFLPSQGGSWGRGTALRGGSDAELIVFLDCFKTYEDLRRLRPNILCEMRAVLKCWEQEPLPDLSLQLPPWNNDGPVWFRLASAGPEKHWMDISLVPAFDALGEEGLVHSRLWGLHSQP